LPISRQERQTDNEFCNASVALFGRRNPGTLLISAFRISRSMRQRVRPEYGGRAHGVAGKPSDARYVISRAAKRSREIWWRIEYIYPSRPDCPSELCASLRVSTPAHSTALRAGSLASGPPWACLRQKRQAARMNRNPPPNVDRTRVRHQPDRRNLVALEGQAR